MDDRPVMRAEGGRCSVCLLREFRVRCSCVDARGIRLGWSGFRTDCGEGGAGKRPSIFFRNFFPDDGGGRGGGLLMRCVFRLALIAFPDAMVIECTRWLVNDAHDALRFLCRYKGKTKKRDRKECKCQKCKNKSVGYKNVNSVM